jgi:nucleoside-diphosphate-sugar epimerase
MKSRILLTGVAGFVGSNLAQRLCSLGDYHVIGIDNLAYGVLEQVPQAVEFHKLDIRSGEIRPLFENVDFVFHLAAKNCITDCQLDPVDTADINVTGTVNVFDAANRAGVKKVIYAESSALYEGGKIFPTPESQINPESFYSVSKAAAMFFANSFERFSKLRFTALRYFCVYGTMQDYRRTIPPVMSAFIIKLLKGEQPVIYGTGTKKRDFVYVDDINDFHVQCITDRRTDGGTFNLGSGKNYSVNEIYKIISDLIKAEIKPVHKQDLPGEAEETLADISNARRLGWSPKTEITDGLKNMINFIKNEFKKGNIK